MRLMNGSSSTRMRGKGYMTEADARGVISQQGKGQGPRPMPEAQPCHQ
jgi:hypothetical protein